MCATISSSIHIPLENWRLSVCIGIWNRKHVHIDGIKFEMDSDINRGIESVKSWKTKSGCNLSSLTLTDITTSITLFLSVAGDRDFRRWKMFAQKWEVESLWKTAYEVYEHYHHQRHQPVRERIAKSTRLHESTFEWLIRFGLKCVFQIVQN